MTTFKVGDLVCHRVSRDRAIVCEVGELCANPEHGPGLIACFGFTHCLGGRNDCKMEPTGMYGLSVGFKDTKMWDGMLLELVDSTPTVDSATIVDPATPTG